MATKSKDEATNRLLWVAGGAAMTGAVMYFVNKNLNERDELSKLRYESDQRKLKESTSE